MKNRFFILCALLVLVFATCAPPHLLDPKAHFDAAVEDWDRGDYISSLQGLIEILTKENERLPFDDIALLTGELFPVKEVAPDGRNVRFSSNGVWILFEVTTDDRSVTHLVPLNEQEENGMIFAGTNLVISSNGSQVVYLVRRQTEDAAKAFEEANALTGRERTRALAQAEIEFSAIAVRDMKSGEERILNTGDLLVTQPLFGADGKNVLFTGGVKDASVTSIFEFNLESGNLRRLTSERGFSQNPALAGGHFLIYRVSSRSPLSRSFQRSMGGGGGRQPDRIVVRDLLSGVQKTFQAGAFILDPAAVHLAYVFQREDQSVLFVWDMESGAEPKEIHQTPNRMGDISFSPRGGKLTFSEMLGNDWEIFVIDADGQNLKRITWDIQHDRRGLFLTENQLIDIKGESRHMRSYLYDLTSGTNIRLFHNNTLRTIAPEYEWSVHPNGDKILFVSERDGDTISPERGVYLMDLSQKISKEALLQRLEISLKGEQDLHTRGRRFFTSIKSEVRERIAEVSERRIYEIEERMMSFDSKYITEPGNAQARNYLAGLFESFGYESVLQLFEARGIKTANILATLEGTQYPEQIYVLSSHFDSNRRSPGADDNTSATAVTLEAARILRDHPQPATILFALFTGEEAGLLGSREFVRQAAEKGLNIVGALNNDMVGWCDNNRMDDTIRYSNATIRDIQHAASFLFTELITYDSHYYKSTDAAAYYEEFGDIVGGIGSYPVLSSPFYHQATDRIEHVNFHLIGEVAKSTIAALMCLTSQREPVTGVVIQEGSDVSEPSQEQKQ